MHLPITEILVFCKIKITNMWLMPINYVDFNASWANWHAEYVNESKTWYMYRIVGWENSLNGFVNYSSCCSRLFDTNGRYQLTNFTKSHKYDGGYFINDNNEFVVKYVTSNVWLPKNHFQWPKPFRDEVWLILLCCNRIKRGMKNVAFIIIQKLAIKVD